MSVDQLTAIPSEIRAGDTINWLISVSDYPASSGWTLKLQFSNATAAFTVASTASGADHLFAVTAATTDDYVAGTYQVLTYVEKGAGVSLERVTLSTLTMKVLPFRAGSSTASDQRTFARKMLDAIEAAILGNASPEQKRMRIDTGSGLRELERFSPDELYKLRATYRAEVFAEEQKAAGKGGGLFMSVPFSFGGGE